MCTASSLVAARQACTKSGACGGGEVAEAHMVGRDSKASAVRGMAAMFVLRSGGAGALCFAGNGTRETSGLGLGLRPRGTHLTLLSP